MSVSMNRFQQNKTTNVHLNLYRFFEHSTALNVVPDPVGFIQANHEFLGHLNYKSPTGCQVTKDGSNNTVQMCNNATENWSYLEWTLTAKPNCFGLIPGIANPTGAALTIILVTICICSLPWVRQSGYFEVITAFPKMFIYIPKLGLRCSQEAS